MNSTLADIKQLFNVKNIAYSTNINALAEGQFGIFAEDSEVSIASGTVYATLPNKIRLVSKVNGKILYSFDTIEKSKIVHAIAKDYVPEQINIWKGVIEACNCINGVQLNINVDEQSLMQRDGFTWTHRDFVVVVSPQELLCACSCDGTAPVYENNVLTNLIYKKIIAQNSPFYTAEVQLPNGTVVPDVDAYIAANKVINTDDDETNDGQLLTLVLKGKLQSGGVYKDLDINYIPSRGVKLNPAFVINGVVAIPFTEVQPLKIEIGSGYELRAEEFENMSFYTNLNFYPQLSDGIAVNDLNYQFENKKNYDTVTFEFYTNKVEHNNGDKRLFGVLLASETPAIANELAAIFIQ